MKLTLEQAIAIQNEFMKKYFGKYLNGCDISTLRMIRDGERTELKLKKGETLDDYCIRGFFKEPPKGIELPDNYRGMRVFYISGWATAFD